MKSIYGEKIKELRKRGWFKLRYASMLFLVGVLVPPAAQSLQRYKVTNELDEAVEFLMEEFDVAREAAVTANRRVAVRFAPGNLVIIESDKDADGRIEPGEGRLVRLPYKTIEIQSTHPDMAFTGSGRLIRNSEIGAQTSQLVSVEHSDGTNTRYIRINRKGFVRVDLMGRGYRDE